VLIRLVEFGAESTQNHVNGRQTTLNNNEIFKKPQVAYLKIVQVIRGNSIFQIVYLFDLSKIQATGLKRVQKYF